MANGLQRPGDVEVISVILINNTGNSIDLYNQMQSISIYESIFASTMSGDILIADALNLLENYNVVGQEKIVIKFRTPGKENIRTNEFNIYKISKRAMIKERVQTYMLHFTSEETILSLRQKISKAYSGKLSDMVNQIYLNTLDTGTKICYIEPTKYEYNYIIPYWEPIQAINWLAGLSVSENNYNNYLFYETMNSFYFMPISTLFEAEVVQEFVYSPPKTPGKNMDEQFRSVKSFSIGNSFNTISNIEKGMYASNKRVLDVVNKTYTDNNYNYEDEFVEAKHLLPNRFTSLTGDFLNWKYTNDYFSSYSYTASQDLHDVKDGLERMSSLLQLRNISILIDIYGDSDLECGHIVNFHIPSAIPTYGEKEMDRYLSGKFIITSIRHNITKNSYDMILEISKDGLENKLPDYAEYNI